MMGFSNLDKARVGYYEANFSSANAYVAADVVRPMRPPVTPSDELLLKVFKITQSGESIKDYGVFMDIQRRLEYIGLIK